MLLQPLSSLFQSLNLSNPTKIMSTNTNTTDESPIFGKANLQNQNYIELMDAARNWRKDHPTMKWPSTGSFQTLHPLFNKFKNAEIKYAYTKARDSVDKELGFSSKSHSTGK